MKLLPLLATAILPVSLVSILTGCVDVRLAGPLEPPPPVRQAAPSPVPATSSPTPRSVTATLTVPAAQSLAASTPTPSLSSERRSEASPTPSPTGADPTLKAEVVQDGMPMLLVPGGSMSMGYDAGILLDECRGFRGGCQRDWFDNVEPAHTVVLDPFYVDLYEVTNASFASFLTELGRHETACLGQDCLELAQSAIVVVGGTYGVAEGHLIHPVNYVSWYGAAAYCAWRGARLPTEAEWEMAAAWHPITEAKRLYPWGDTFVGRLANTCDSSCREPQAVTAYEDGYAEVAPVGRFPEGRSPCGVHDMAGNLWEWVADWYAADYYRDSPTVNPIGPVAGSLKLVRGGSWFDTGNFANAVFRVPVAPDVTDDSIGFRCALSATP